MISTQLLNSSPKEIVWINSFILSIVTVLLVGVFVTPFYDKYCQAWALVSLIFVLVPFFLFLQSKEITHLTFLPVIALTWTYFLRPYLKSEEVYYPGRFIPNEYIHDMVLFPALGVILLFIGYYISWNSGKVNPISSVSYRFSNNALVRVTYWFIVLSIINMVIYQVFFIQLNTGQLFQIINNSTTILVSLTVLYIYRGGKNKVVVYLASMLIAVELIYSVAQTLSALIVYMLIGGFFVYSLEKKKIPWKMGLLVLLLGFPIYVNRFEHREDASKRWSGESKSDFSLVLNEGINIITNDFSRFYGGDDPSKPQVQEIDRFEATSYLGHLVYIHKFTTIEYKYGSTFLWLPLSILPRVIFPFKPSNNMDTDLAAEYGLRNPNFSSAFNFPQFAEAFINFGFWGIVVWGFFQGFLIKWVFAKVGFLRGDINLLAFINFCYILVNVESNITMVFGVMLQSLVFWWLLSKIVFKVENKLNPTGTI